MSQGLRGSIKATEHAAEKAAEVLDVLRSRWGEVDASCGPYESMWQSKFCPMSLLRKCVSALNAGQIMHKYA